MVRDASSLSGRRAAPLLLLLAFGGAGVVSLRGDAITFDETAHLPAGIAALERRDFRMNPEHPPLGKAWAALPLVATGRTDLPYGHPSWRAGDQWAFGFVALNGPPDVTQRLDPRRLLWPARLATLVVAVALGWLVFVWSRRLWGDGGGLVSLALYCLSPTMLAHGRLVTTDLWAAGAVAAGVWGLWRVTERASPGRVAALAGICGAAVLTKFSSLLLGPILAVAALAWVVAGPPGDRRRRATVAAATGVACVAAAWLALWAAYGFRFAASPDPAFALDRSVVSGAPAALHAAIDRALAWRLLPEAYLYGLEYAVGGAARRAAFLDGEISLTGWWWYFPRALMLKTPPAVLVLVGWAVAVVTLRHRRTGPLLPLLAATMWLGVAMTANLNIGHRHLAPLEPLLFVVAGSLATLWPRRPARLTLSLLLAGAVVSFGLAAPRPLSYVNALGGGGAGGWRHLLDSNVDWGQDLTRLRRWCEAHRVERIDLAYFGTADPRAWGVRYRRVAMVHDFRPWLPTVRPEPGALVAVSVNLLGGLYTDRDRELAEALVRRGWLSESQVRRWLEERDRLTLAGRRVPPIDAWAVSEGLIDARQADAASATTLAGWLSDLRERGEVVGRAGDSILVLRVPPVSR